MLLEKCVLLRNMTIGACTTSKFQKKFNSVDQDFCCVLKCADTRHIAARSHRRQDLFIAIYVHQQAHARHWHLLMSDGDVIKQHLLELEGLVSKHTPRVSTINAQLHRFQVKIL